MYGMSVEDRTITKAKVVNESVTKKLNDSDCHVYWMKKFRLPKCIDLEVSNILYLHKTI